MARPPATPEQRALVRQRLQRAAAEIHRDEGIEAVTVRNVTKLAGVSPGALYNSFSSIGALLRSLWMEPVAAAGAGLDELVASEPDPVARLRVLFESFVTFVVRNPEIHRGAMLFVRPPSAPEDSERHPPSSLPFYRHVRDAIADGQRGGSIRSGDPDLLAQLAWSALHGALALPVNAELYDLSPGEQIAPEMIDALLTAFTVTPGVAPRA